MLVSHSPDEERLGKINPGVTGPREKDTGFTPRVLSSISTEHMC